MSFSNPVNEPVKRFSSTDADAPQINYNARTAGDVKAVLKACLVTGYGAVASAGWTSANELANVCEFVSPSVAMSDYRLGIDDASTSSTTWYYQYRDTRVNPLKNTPSKNITMIDKSSASNGWTLLVTERGFWFLEHFMHSRILDVSTRMTYFGQVKLAVPSEKNICFLNEGHDGAGFSERILTIASQHYAIDGQSASSYVAASPFIDNARNSSYYGSSVKLDSDIYITNSVGGILAKQVGLLARSVGLRSDVYGLKTEVVGGRSVLVFCAARGGNLSGTDLYYDTARNFLVHIDYWEY